MINFDWTSRRAFLLYGGVLVVILLFVFAYLTFIAPMNAKLETVQKQLEMEKKLLSAVEKKQPEEINPDIQSSRGLQQRVPVAPLSDQLLLSFERAEVLSDTTILTMTFGDETLDPENLSVIELEAEGEQEQQGQQSIEDGETGSNDETENIDPAQPEDKSSLPQGINRIKVNMSVRTSSYENMHAFISTLENNERILKVDNISFSGKHELDEMSEDDKKELLFTIQISAFYVTGLDELKDELPYVQYPEGADKENPFYQEEENEEKNDQQ
ncbi:GspMb/PilO family protein [Pseudalkalibacillus caeni]|uniref:Type II secretion system protein M n=1 Tax=Exobacillus caeni TaxID=2574798 RepID=A0A5R9FC49_9BACL|nr:GspMb/PilO family protein [Pseudalkalibacillus caeni]TLS39238.1 type II secretion system protein M [Pseudalkalibacillus caeni]